MAGRLGRFMNRKDGETAGNPCGSENHAFAERQHRSNDLRVRVPPTRLEIKPGSNVSSLPALAEAIAARHPLSPDSEPGSQRNKFDETEFEESTISSIDEIAREQLVLHPQHLGQQHGGVDDEHGDRANPKEEEDDDDDDDDDDENHHFYHGNNLHSHHPPDVQVNPALYDEIAVARRAIPDNARDFRAQSPATANLPLQTVAARSTSPVTFRDAPPSRPHSHQTISMPPPAKPENKPTVVTSATTTATKTNVFDKTSSYTDSSAERSPLAPNDAREEKRRKRPISDLLDYDPQSLQNLSFPDLDNQPFDIDPRRPPDNNTTSASTTPTSSDPHLQKLHTLKSLSSSDRDKFFSSQTKDQWVASTEFFEKRLTELFDELRIARERRRDVARRFEAEIRGRMEAVERSGEGIEKCLGEIRGKAKGVLPARGATPVR